MIVQDLIDDAGIDRDELAAHYQGENDEQAQWYDTSAELA
jgi:hypothetical protein